jgi:hypothetical protein
VGDPGMPIMAGLLAVPVGVLLLVIVLALMGRRWAAPGVLDEEPYEDHDEAEEYAPPDPWDHRPSPERQWPTPPPVERARHALPPVERPRHALPPAQPRYGSLAALPPARPPERDRPLALPPARSGHASAPDSYGSSDPYDRPYEREAYDRHRRPEEPSRDEPAPRGFPYGPYRHQ